MFHYKFNICWRFKNLFNKLFDKITIFFKVINFPFYTSKAISHIQTTWVDGTIFKISLWSMSYKALTETLLPIDVRNRTRFPVPK